MQVNSRFWTFLFPLIDIEQSTTLQSYKYASEVKLFLKDEAGLIAHLMCQLCRMLKLADSLRKESA